MLVDRTLRERLGWLQMAGIAKKPATVRILIRLKYAAEGHLRAAQNIFPRLREYSQQLGESRNLEKVFLQGLVEEATWQDAHPTWNWLQS